MSRPPVSLHQRTLPKRDSAEEEDCLEPAPEFHAAVQRLLQNPACDSSNPPSSDRQLACSRDDRPSYAEFSRLRRRHTERIHARVPVSVASHPPASGSRSAAERFSLSKYSIHESATFPADRIRTRQTRLE